ncbi:MAG: ParA family protein [Chloroflexaceae bacterium]|jgi:chromosome partitioning protein|nr:ParA family protein [Chloroflexaceae bacterium]
MGRVVAVTNLKGGIGKTTTVVNLGAGLALKGAKVLLVDVDVQGNLAMALGTRFRRTLYDVLVDGVPAADCVVAARPNLDLLPSDDTLIGAQATITRRSDWSRVLTQALQPLVSRYDYIFVDCSGSLTVLNINALMAAADVLVPTTVEHLSVKGVELLYKQLMRLKQGSSSVRAIIPTMYDPRLRQSGALLAELQQLYGTVVAPPIRINVRLSEASAEGRTIYEYDPHSRGAVDYANLVEHVSQKLGFTGPAPAPVEAPPPLPVAPAPKATPPERPLVTGTTGAMHLSCPHCGRPMQRATVAGYRVAYCDYCKYKQQDLVGGARR